jgi:hypothetical protein
MNSKLRKNLKSIKGWVNGALIFVGLPIVPFLVMTVIVLLFSNFNILGVFNFWFAPQMAVPMLTMCFCGVPLLALSRHVKKCLNQEKKPSAKIVSFLRFFFMIALGWCCGFSLFCLVLYSSVGLNVFSLFVAFLALTALIGSMFAFKAFNKAREACEQ